MAHLHAILAMESPSAILLKRGPGRCTVSIGWDRTNDTFQIGQWVKQIIEHDRADLSPDGEYFVFFVNTNLLKSQREYSVYRAISRAPWLKALAFWGTDSWTKGPSPGMFFRGEDGVLRLCAQIIAPVWDHLGIEIVEHLPETAPWKSMVKAGYSQWVLRLQRDGWQALTNYGLCPPDEAAGQAQWQKSETEVYRMIFEKPLPYGWALRQTHWCGSHDDHNRGISWESFSLVAPSRLRIENQQDWEWADVDPDRQRVVWTANCTLYAATMTRRGLGPAKQLLRTKGMTFQAREAPY